ncbi:hypothetical protein [Streptomyces microflavus]|uniref:hypothetical protein n=1 Tax=Streptomyces microflavus TaxID=1919 RepID=UPI003B21197F
MTHPSAEEAREKLLVNLTPELRRDLRIRAAEHGLNMQDAVASALSLWYETASAPEVEHRGAKSWGYSCRPVARSGSRRSASAVG